MARGGTNAVKYISTGTDTSDATAVAGDIVAGKTAYVASGKVTGALTNYGAIQEWITDLNFGVYTTTAGHFSSIQIDIDASEKAKVISDNIRSGVTLLGIAGASAVVNTSDATAVAADLLASKTAYVNGTKVTGVMVNRGAVSTDITTKAQNVTIAQGYHSGAGVVKISTTEQNKIIGSNIKAGVTILGTSGTVQELTPLSVNNSISSPPTTSFNHTTQLSGWVGKTIVVRWATSSEGSGSARILQQTVSVNGSGSLIFYVVSSTSVRLTSSTSNTTISSTSTQVSNIGGYTELYWSIYEAI